MNRIEKKQNTPFYSTNHLSRPTASQLMEEAKASLSKPSRPFTPHPRGRILKVLTKNQGLELVSKEKVLEPIAPVGPAKTSKRRVRVKSVEDGNVSVNGMELEKVNLNQMNEENVEIPFWNEFLHYVEPFDRVDLSILRSNPNPTIVTQAIEAIQNSNDSRRIQQLSTIVLEFCSKETPIEPILETLYDISCDDIEKPFKLYTDCLLNYLLQGNHAQQLYIVSIFGNMSNSILSHDELLCFGVFERLCDFFVNVKIENPQQESQLLKQIIGFIYNIIASNDCFHLLDNKVITRICDLADYNSVHYADYGFILSCFKTLAVCSEHPAFLDILAHQPFITSLFDRTIECSQEPLEHTSFLLRIFYILGNLTSTQQLASQYITETMDDVIALFGILLEEIYPESKQTSDLLLKMIRYIANIALIPEAGALLKTMIEINDLFKFLDSEDEELQLNTISCLANISFYTTKDDLLFQEYASHFKKLIPQLMSDNQEIVTETARILSNITRYPLPLSNHIIHITKIATMLLDHQEVDIITYACGILMNLLKNNVAKEVMDLGGSEKVLEVIEMALDSQNYRLATLASQALFNLYKSTEISSCVMNDLKKLMVKDMPINIHQILTQIL